MDAAALMNRVFGEDSSKMLGSACATAALSTSYYHRWKIALPLLEGANAADKWGVKFVQRAVGGSVAAVGVADTLGVNVPGSRTAAHITLITFRALQVIQQMQICQARVEAQEEERGCKPSPPEWMIHGFGPSLSISLWESFQGIKKVLTLQSPLLQETADRTELACRVRLFFETALFPQECDLQMARVGFPLYARYLYSEGPEVLKKVRSFVQELYGSEALFQKLGQWCGRKQDLHIYHNYLTQKMGAPQTSKGWKEVDREFEKQVTASAAA